MAGCFGAHAADSYNLDFGTDAVEKGYIDLKIRDRGRPDILRGDHPYGNAPAMMRLDLPAGPNC